MTEAKPLDMRETYCIWREYEGCPDEKIYLSEEAAEAALKTYLEENELEEVADEFRVETIEQVVNGDFH